MNLHEQTYRIKQMMRVVNEETKSVNTDAKVIAQLNKWIDEHIAKAKSKLPTLKINVIDPNIIIDKVGTYLKSTIPTTLQNIKLGKGGDTFVYNVYTHIIPMIDSEINEIGWMKKKTIQALAPSKEELKKMLEQSEAFDDYLEMFNDTVDFSFGIGWMNEVKPYENNILKFTKQKDAWLDKNKLIIKNIIINKILKFVYS